MSKFLDRNRKMYLKKNLIFFNGFNSTQNQLKYSELKTALFSEFKVLKTSFDATRIKCYIS